MALHSFTNNFTSGELSPAVQSRTDLIWYKNGCLTMENAIPKPEGGFRRRGGARFIAKTKFPDKVARLIPFKFSVTQNYMVEVGDEYMRFFTANARLEEAALSVTGAVDNGSGAIRITVSADHGLRNAISVWSVEASPETFTDITAAFNDDTDADATIFPATEAVGDYIAFGMREKFSAIDFDNLNGTAGVGGVVDWQYWDGLTWLDIPVIIDDTTGFTAAVADAVSFSFSIPTDWQTRPIGDALTGPGLESLYYIRAIISTVYTTNPVYDQLRVLGTDRKVSGAVRGVVGTTEANDDWVCTIVGDTTLDLDTSVFANTFVSGGTFNQIVEIASPWFDNELLDIRFAQDADIMFMVHPVLFPRRLTRIGATTFTLFNITNFAEGGDNFWRKGPFQVLNSNATHTMTPSATTGTVTITASKALFVLGHRGMYIRIGGTTGTPAEQGVARITVFTSSTVVTAEVVSTLDGTAATDNWALGSWGNGVFPSDVTFFEQRLLFANSALQPQTLWFSSTNDIYDFSIGTDPDDPVSAALRTEDVNVIQWIAAHDDLLVGTQGGEYFMTGGDNVPITPSNIFVRQQSNYGGEPLKSVKIGNTVVYVQRGGARIRDLEFTFEQERYLSDDLNLLADHIFPEDQIIDMAFQLTPEPILWVVSISGLLVSLTILKTQEVLGWARHPLTNGVVESAGVIPSVVGEADELWITVKRVVDGNTVRYVEYLDDTIFMDSAISNIITPSTTISGLDHLEGQVVAINGDGAVYNNQTVTNGSVTLATGELAITLPMIGLPFTPTVIPTSPEFDLGAGPTYGLKKRFTKMLVFANDTMTLEFSGEQVAARDADDTMDAAPAIDSTAIFQYTQLGSAEILSVAIKQPLPLAMDVRSMYGEVEIGE